MVNFRDPEVVTADFLALVKLWHAVDGLYLWEFFTTLDYEWNVIRGNIPYKKSIWIYSFTRVATLVSVILNMGGVDISTPINCQVWITFGITFGSMAFVAASLLIVLRIIAIWNKNKVVAAIALGMVVTNFAFFVQGIVRLRYTWVPERESCMALNPQLSKLHIISTLATDISLLVIMLIGLLRLRGHRGSRFGLAQLLWKQGVIWLFLATVAEVTPAVFVCLNLNDPLDLMFQVPTLIIMSIAATRMHRSLVDFVTSTNIAQVNLKNSSRTVSNIGKTHVTRVPGTQMKVVVHTTYVQYPASQMSHSGLSVGMDGQVDDKRRGQSLHDDVESGA